MPPVPTSMILVVAAIAHSSGIGAEACSAKWWTRKDALFTPISSPAWVISRRVLAIFFRRWPALAAEGVMPEA